MVSGRTEEEAAGVYADQARAKDEQDGSGEDG